MKNKKVLLKLDKYRKLVRGIKLISFYRNKVILISHTNAFSCAAR